MPLAFLASAALEFAGAVAAAAELGAGTAGGPVMEMP